MQATELAPSELEIMEYFERDYKVNVYNDLRKKRKTRSHSEVRALY